MHYLRTKLFMSFPTHPTSYICIYPSLLLSYFGIFHRIMKGFNQLGHGKGVYTVHFTNKSGAD